MTKEVRDKPSGKRQQENSGNKPTPPEEAHNEENSSAHDQKQDEQISGLEKQSIRVESRMLFWTAVVGIFTVVLAATTGLQLYSLIEIERAFIVVKSISYIGGEPAEAPSGLDMRLAIKNVGKHTASGVNFKIKPAFFIIQKALDPEPVYPADSDSPVVAPISASEDRDVILWASIDPKDTNKLPLPVVIAGVIDGTIPLRVWGRIEYDIGFPSFGPGTTGFCFEYVAPSKRRLGRQFETCRNPKYTYAR